MRRSRLMQACLVAGTLVLSACSTEQGRAVASDDTKATPASPPVSESSPNGGDGGATKLAEVDSCALLSEDQLAALGKNIQRETVGELSCHWSSKGVSPRSNDYIIIQIDIRPTQTVNELKALNSGTLTEGRVNDREARQVAADTTEGACIIGFAADAGRVDILTQANTTERGCDVAGRVAELIEPKLPEPTTS